MYTTEEKLVKAEATMNRMLALHTELKKLARDEYGCVINSYYDDAAFKLLMALAG